MTEKAYHHGNLQTELIEEGLNLLHEHGPENFSLRKLAKRVGVSPTACYRYYSNIDSLLNEMKAYVTQKFVIILKEGAQCEDPKYAGISMGKAYVNFFAENPHYFSYLYDNGNYRIELTKEKFQGDYEPFCVFSEMGTECLRLCGIPEEHYVNNLVAMWAAVHGLAAMANMKGFYYDGDWGELAETILKTKIILS